MTTAVCPLTPADQWPNMCHSCGAPDCAHWYHTSGSSQLLHSSTSSLPESTSRTWLQMNAPATDCSDAPTGLPTDEPTGLPTDEPTAAPTDEPTAAPTDEPTAAPTKETPCESTCFGRAAGMTVIAGLNVYCDGNGRVLVQSADPMTCDVSSYGVLTTVGVNSCGYLSEPNVRMLAMFSNGVTLQDGSRFGDRMTESTGSGAIEALQTGVSWQGNCAAYFDAVFCWDTTFVCP